MNVQVNNAPKSQKELKIELPYTVLEMAMDEESEKFSKNAKISGFRPGKAPKDVVKKQNYHRIRSAAIEKVITDAMRESLVSNNINPIAQPEVKDVIMEDDLPISFTIMVDVYPEFSITKFSGFKFDKTNIKITDKDVDSTIKSLLERYSEFKKISRKRKSKIGDQTIIDFEGKLDGVPFAGGKADGHTLELGSNQFIPGFEDGVVGMNIGDIKDISVKFPNDYHEKSLAGQDVVFTVTLHEINEKQAPELNDEFAKMINPRTTTMDELTKAIEKDLQFEADQYVKFETFTKILDKVMEENPFDVPTSVVAEQAERMATQNLQQYYQMGINPEMFGMSPKSIAPQFMDEAERQVKRALIISKISDEQNIGVTDEDITKELEKVSEMSGRSVDELKQSIEKPEQMAALQNDLLSDKAYAYLLEQNTFKEVTMSRDDFEKAKSKEAEEKKEEGK